MKKTLLLILVFIAVPLYSYNMWLVLRLALPGDKKVAIPYVVTHDVSIEQMLQAAAPVVFEFKGRDPFTMYTVKPVPVVRSKPVVRETKPAKEVSPPPITITGIMWNPDNPIATIKLPGGKTTLVKTGQKLGDNLTVKRIDKKSIAVVYEGKEFTIDRR